jgi:hypothetical protein
MPITIHEEAGPMPFVACPSCGERGKIPETMVGARIKCRKCGSSFNVAPSAAKAAATAGAAVAAQGATERLEAPAHGIVVEGLDDSAWTAKGDQQAGLRKEDSEGEGGTGERGEVAGAFEAHGSSEFKEYKIICSRDKIFEGKFDLTRLEEVINDFARQGWVVRAMTNPHLKGFGEGTKEEIVVLLER